MTENPKNQTFIAIDPDLECSWRFKIGTDAATASMITDDLLGKAETLVELSNPFLVPTEVEYGIGWLEFDVPIENLNDSPTGPHDFSRRSLRSSEGIQYDELKAKVNLARANEERVPLLSVVDFVATKSNLRLSSGDNYVDRDSPLAKSWRHGAIRGDEPILDPVRLAVKLAPPWFTPDGRPAAYMLTVVTSTDIWFDDTEFGRINHKRLSRLLRGLYESFEIFDVEVDSNRFEEAELQALLQYDA